MVIGTSDLKKFMDESSSKRLVIFGAGKLLRMFDANYRELLLAERVEYIVDNDINKNGGLYELNGREIPIRNVECLLDDNSNIVILIVSRYDSWDIYSQLEQYIELKNTTCYFASMMISKRVDNIEYIPSNIDSISIIPKKIHCFWFSGEPKDELSSRCIESWKKICPDYEIIEWNTNNYDVTKNKFMYDAFKARKWAYVSDYARIDVLNKYGGIYLDLDVELLKRPDELLANNCFIGFGPIRDVEAAAFGSVPNSELTKKMLKIYDNLEFPTDLSKLVVQPVYLNKLLKDNGIEINGKFQRNDLLTILPKDIFSGKNWFTGKIETNSKSIGVHHCAAGWVSDEVKARIKKGYIDNALVEKLYIDD